MGLFDYSTEITQNPQENQDAVTKSDIIINQLKTLSLHSKLVLCACISLLFKDNNTKVTVMDVFTKYKKLTARFNINWLSISKVTEHIKELEMLGFLKCKYPPKGRREIKHIQIFDPTEIPKYVAVLQEDLGRNIEKS